MRKKVAMSWQQIQPHLEKKGELHYTEVAMILGVGVSSAIAICKSIPVLVEGVKYERGVLKYGSE